MVAASAQPAAPTPAPEAQGIFSSGTTPSAAQPQTDRSVPPVRPRDAAVDARYKVRIMEGVLEKAVSQAALLLNQQLRAFSPDLIQLTGAARARGYRLEGYGLFFDVEVPAALRQTMGWTARVIKQRNATVQQALRSLKRLSDGLDGKARAEAELAVRQLELFILPDTPALSATRLTGASASPSAASNAARGTTVAATSVGGPTVIGEPLPAPAPPPSVAADAAAGPSGPLAQGFAESAPAAAAPQSPPINPLLLENPDLAYEVEVREALISAMVEWGGQLPLGVDEWLTVAARDNQDVVIPGDAAEVVTIIMRVKGSDLADYRAGRVTLEDVRRRVEVREF
ncbi:MAG TPA: hypothetical protein VIL35_02840 [Vicinamibacterales bacterium]